MQTEATRRACPAAAFSAARNAGCSTAARQPAPPGTSSVSICVRASSAPATPIRIPELLSTSRPSAETSSTA